MSMRPSCFAIISILLLSYFQSSSQAPISTDVGSVFVPAGGNAWLSGVDDVLDSTGIVNWANPKSVCTMYFRVDVPGDVGISLLMKAAHSSTMMVSVLGESKLVEIAPNVPEHKAGTWKVATPGYAIITIKGATKTSPTFGSLSGISLSGSAVTGSASYVKDNEGNYFYWGRRGPSVHLRYDLQGKTDIEWFYSEITVPEKNDVIGSYYMANGFGEGYFGMQVNSPTERRVLFSVWSPYKTDDPKSIPESDRIILLKKGEGVTSGEFGNEGSGGQSFFRYMWKAGQTYSFLLRGQPDGAEATVYTAWFFAPETRQWKLIASFRRPKKTTYLTSLYSFLENFIPETGNIERRARYGNQWVRDTSGKWIELTSIKFTGDNTARKNYRKDYGGGTTEGSFFLRNCGFFSDYTGLDQTFSRPPSGAPPKIDFHALP